MKTENKRILLQSSVVLDYACAGQMDKPKSCILFLHGYQEKGDRFLEKVASILPQGALGLAPCGLYPIPVKTEKGHRIGYSWYFYNPATDEYFIDMTPATDLLENLIEMMGLQNTPKKIVGFSQGGYLAPQIAYRLKNVDQVIGMGCEFLPEELPRDFKVRVDLVHGQKDDVVTEKSVIESYEKGIQMGFNVHLHSLPETGHRIDDKMLEVLSALISDGEHV